MFIDFCNRGQKDLTLFWHHSRAISTPSQPLSHVIPFKSQILILFQFRSDNVPITFWSRSDYSILGKCRRPVLCPGQNLSKIEICGQSKKYIAHKIKLLYKVYWKEIYSRNCRKELKIKGILFQKHFQPVNKHSRNT